MTAVSEAIHRLVKKYGEAGVVAEIEKQEAVERNASAVAQWEQAIARLAEIPGEKESKLTPLKEVHERALSEWNAWENFGRLRRDNELRSAIRTADSAVSDVQVSLDTEWRRQLETAETLCPFRDLISQSLERLEAEDRSALANGDKKPRLLSGDDTSGFFSVGSRFLSRQASMSRRREAIREARGAARRLAREKLTAAEAKARIDRVFAGLPKLQDEVFEVAPRENKFVRVARPADLVRA